MKNARRLEEVMNTVEHAEWYEGFVDQTTEEFEVLKEHGWKVYSGVAYKVINEGFVPSVRLEIQKYVSNWKEPTRITYIAYAGVRGKYIPTQTYHQIGVYETLEEASQDAQELYNTLCDRFENKEMLRKGEKYYGLAASHSV